jgi:hypothetical protein
VAYKNIEDSRAAVRRHYYKNKEKYLERNRKRREEIRQYIRDIKASSACKDCGKQYPYFVMDFDHLGNKNQIISRLVLSNNFSALKKEIENCDLVCSNCHRVRTFTRIGKSSI